MRQSSLPSAAFDHGKHFQAVQPANNSRLGGVELGLAFVLLFATAFYAAWRTAGLRRS